MGTRFYVTNDGAKWFAYDDGTLRKQGTKEVLSRQQIKQLYGELTLIKTTRSPEVEAIRYRVSCIPYRYENAHHLTLWVEKRDIDKWCVTDGSYCYRSDGTREYESLPSSRTDEFKTKTRFSLEEAVELAKQIAPTLTIMGKTVDEIMAFEDRVDEETNKGKEGST